MLSIFRVIKHQNVFQTITVKDPCVAVERGISFMGTYIIIKVWKRSA